VQGNCFEQTLQLYYRLESRRKLSTLRQAEIDTGSYGEKLVQHLFLENRDGKLKPLMAQAVEVAVPDQLNS